MAAIRIRKVIESDRLPELLQFMGQEVLITLEVIDRSVEGRHCIHRKLPESVRDDDSHGPAVG